MEPREDRLKERESYVQRAKAAQLLDAVFLVHYYNAWRQKWGPPPKQGQYADTLRLAQRMLDEASHVAMAMLKYPQAARSAEEEMQRFKNNNPGFSEESYTLAVSAAVIAFR